MDKKNENGKEKANFSKIDLLLVEMQKVIGSMNKYYSLKHTFLKGIVYGLGFVLGTTIVAGILLTVATHFFDHIPFQSAMENKILGK